MGHKPTHILIVEDHQDSAQMLSKLLSRACLEDSITVCGSCREAIETAKKRRFDLLLCDIGLPDGDGCEVLREVRAMYPIRAIVITAYVMAADIQRYQRAGFDDFLSKPFDFEKLIECIDKRVMASEETGPSDFCR